MQLLTSTSSKTFKFIHDETFLQIDETFLQIAMALEVQIL